MIVLKQTAKVFNNTGPRVVIDGGGQVTLSGDGVRRILYMNTCDPNQVWTTSHCQNQDHPQLTVQNLTFINGNSKGEEVYDGGGAVWVRGGRFKIVNSRFFNNVCADNGPDVGGAAVRVFSQYQGQPVYVVNSTFGGGRGTEISVPTAAASAVSASLTRLSIRCFLTTGPAATGPTRPGRGRPAAGAEAPFITTATPLLCLYAGPASNTIRPTRAGAPFFLSATIAPVRFSSKNPFYPTTPARDLKRPAIRASIFWGMVRPWS